MKPVVVTHEPFSRRGGVSGPKSFTYQREIGERLSDVLMELSPDRWGGQHVEVYKGNYTEEDKLDLRETTNVFLSEDDRYIVVILPAAPLALGILGGGSFTSFLVSTAIGFGLSFLSASLKPTPWVGPGSASRTKPTPLNALDPPRNQSRLGSRIPSILGKMRTWPDLIYPPYEFWTGRIQKLYSAYNVTEGTATLEDLHVGETPLESISGAEATILLPGQAMPAEFNLVRANSTFQNVVLDMAQEVTDPNVGTTAGWAGPDVGWTDWIRLPDGNASQLWVQFLLPNGALSSEYKYGTSGTYHHRVDIQYRRINQITGAIETQGSTHWADSRATTSPHRFTHVMQVSVPGLYEIRMRRSDNSLGRAQGGADIDEYRRGVVVESASSFSTLTSAQRTNDTTRVMLKFTNINTNAQAAVNSQSRFNVVAQRHLPQVDLGGGGIAASAPTSRWIDAMYYMLTDLFLGDYPENEVDLASLIKVQKTMVSRVPPGEASESGEFNALFDQVMTVDEQVQVCAAAARATLFSDGSSVIAAVDADNRYDEDGNLLEEYERVTALFNRRNRVDSDLEAGIAMRAALPTEADGVEVRWIDRDANWQKRTFVYTPSGSATALRPIRAEIVGITSWLQAWRHAAYLFRRNLYRRKSTTLRCFEEARLLQIFDTVSVVQPWREVVLDGHIIEYDDTVPGFYYVFVDQDVDSINPMVDTIRIRSTDGNTTEVFDILEVISSTSRIRLGVRGGGAPHIDIMVGIPSTQLGNLFSIASDADHEKDNWLVLGTNAQTYEGTVTLANADNRVFDGDKIAAPGYTEVPFTVPRAPVLQQHPCLALWFWPEVDQTFFTRKTRFQDSFEFAFSTSGPGGNINPLGIRMRPNTSDADVLTIDTGTPGPSAFSWWNPTQSGSPGSIPDAGIWYFDFEFESSAVPQSATKFLWYYRRLNTEYVSVTIDSDGQLNFQYTLGGATNTRPLNAFVTAAGRVRIAVHFSDSGSNVFSYVGFGASDPSPVRSVDAAYDHPDIYVGMSDFLLCFTSPASAHDGTIHLREHRFYNCATEESFVEDLAKGLVTEVPL